MGSAHVCMHTRVQVHYMRDLQPMAFQILLRGRVVLATEAPNPTTQAELLLAKVPFPIEGSRLNKKLPVPKPKQGVVLGRPHKGYPF